MLTNLFNKLIKVINKKLSDHFNLPKSDILFKFTNNSL